MATIKLHDILWRTKNGGASPDDNRRTELYFAGCRKALSGNPCKNCFNPALWDNKNHIPHESKEIADALDAHKIPKYITIVGGEPTDQPEGLQELIDLLWERHYEIILFTWHDVEYLLRNFGMGLFNKIAYAVCGPYDEAYRIYDTSKDDGVHNVIGSANQVIAKQTFNGWDSGVAVLSVGKIDKIEYKEDTPQFILKDGSLWS